MELIRIEPDKEKARSLLKLAELRESKLPKFKTETDSPLITETYYEICKELITAILFCNGYKTLSHKDLIDYILQFKDFKEEDIHRLDVLRKKRNRLVYYGVFTEPGFIKSNKAKYKEIIKKLKRILKEKLI
ncbi:hypothetical protein AYK26_02095 [Euryarchaeota archaeon SM23-78]|nr:MAG: hypothetical protein AYK26_02095 [Euryarchaeota archaeon SM23-78]MBW3000361.1 hypothetical protein [Candidatus Woesearchaeota archaeon]